MPIEVELPDGSIAEFPDGTDNATMERALSSYAAPRPKATTQAQKPKRGPDFSNVQSRTIGSTEGKGGITLPRGPLPTVAYRPGMGRIEGPERTLDDAGVAQAEMEVRARGADVRGYSLPVRAAYGAGSAVAKNARGLGQLLGVVSQEDEAQARDIGKYSADDAAVRLGGFGADVAMYAMPASKIGALPTAGRYAASAALGAGVGAAQPITTDESRGTNAAIGGLTGLGGQGLADGLTIWGQAAAKKITPELRALYEKAKANGIQLTPAQLSDSAFVKRATLMLDRLPFSGATGRANRQQAAGNKAVARLIGEEADTVDQSVVASAAERLGGEFDQVFANGMKFDRGFLRDVATLKKEAASQMDDTAIRSISGWVDRLKAQSKGGQVSGRTLQSLDQSARKAATGGGDRQQVATAFREALHDAFGRQAPAATKQAWDTARRQYAILKTLEPVVARNTEGGIPMQQLQGAINATKSGRTARARGRDGELGALASIGQRMKPPTSSGTAENLQAAGIGAGTISNPLLTLLTLGMGGVGSRAVNSGTLSNLVMRRGAGQTRQSLAPVARAVVTPAAGQKRDDKSRRRP